MIRSFEGVIDEQSNIRLLEPVVLAPRLRVIVTVLDEPLPAWQDRFERLVARVQSRYSGIPSDVIEADITAASEEVKAERRSPYRGC